MKPKLSEFLQTNKELQQQFIYDQENAESILQKTIGSKTKALWKCNTCSQTNLIPIYQKVKFVNRCSVCSGTRIVSGINDFASKFPHLIQMWSENNEKLPSEVSWGGEYKPLLKCLTDESHPEWKTSLGHISRGSGCPECSKQIIAQKNTKPAKKCDRGLHNLTKRIHKTCQKCFQEFDNLSVTHPEIASELVDIEEAKDVSFGSAKSLEWRCTANDEHTWIAPVYTRTGNNSTSCPKCANIVSKPEEEFIETITKNLTIDFVRNSRSVISPYEIDLYFPSKKIGIEFNGVYWHSENKRGAAYHYDKFKAAQEKGIQLIQIWDTEWRDNKDIVLNLIHHKLGVSSQPKMYARNTYTSIISKDEARVFLNNNHIQGYAASSYYYGLKDKVTHQLVSVMTFKRNHDEIILNRYATSRIVTGGFTKLLSSFTKIHSSQRIVSFSDNLISDGSLYEKHGFILEKEVKYDYKYLIQKNLVHKFNYRLKRFREDPKLKYEDGLSESELAALNNIEKVYDAGKVRWVLEKI